ncbi:MAG TPA: DUF2231 domain-containing protein [Candidatus Limnocylindria bacterium]|nr:DUF2231 domain-containing protein [Candidatus Limnocylindria bacterium]
MRPFGLTTSRLAALSACLALATLAGGAPSALAHKRHSVAPAEASRASADSAVVLRDSTIARNADSAAARFAVSPAVDSFRVAALPTSDDEPPFRMPPMREALFEHAHNAIVHFPIAFTLAALGLTLFARGRPGFGSAARLLLWLAALGATAAFFSGRIQEQNFEGEPKEWLVELHEKLGIATALGLWTWLAIASWERSRRFAWLLGLIVAVLVGITAFYGGVVAHAH